MPDALPEDEDKNNDEKRNPVKILQKKYGKAENWSLRGPEFLIFLCMSKYIFLYCIRTIMDFVWL